MAALVRDEYNGSTPSDFSGMVRRRVRDEIVKQHLLEQMVHDIKYLLSDDGTDNEEQDAVYLWDNIKDRVENGRQYSENKSSDYDSDNDD